MVEEAAIVTIDEEIKQRYDRTMKCKTLREDTRFYTTRRAALLSAQVTKRILFTLVFSLLCVSCEYLGGLRGSSAKKATREVQGLNGPIHSVAVATAMPVDKDGTWEPGEQKLVSVETYDKKGNRTERVTYAADGTVSGKIAFIYDKQGNETEAIWYNPAGTPQSRIISTYDDKGHKIEARSYTANGALLRRAVFTYDARGNETAAHSYIPEGVLESSTVSTYDDNGNLEETAWYYADGKQQGQLVYKRDAKGTLLSSVAFEYAPDGTLQSRTDSTYDARGNPTEVIWYGDNSKSQKKENSTYRYDIFGNWTQQTTTKWASTDSKSFFEPPIANYRTLTYYGKGAE